MINIGTWSANQVGHALAEVIKRLNIADRDASAVIVNMLIAVVESIPDYNPAALSWVDEVASTALQKISHSQIQAVMNMVRSEIYQPIPGSTDFTDRSRIVPGDRISMNVNPDVTWEVLEIGDCRKHGTLEPSHLAYRVENTGTADSWVCCLHITKAEAPGNADT